MSNVDPLSAVAKLSRPINTLILKISEAAGVLYEPTRIVRKAKAEAKANEITAISKLRIKEIQKRALVRFVNEETIKQMNIESTLEQALPQIKDTASPERIENDWISLFFDKIKLVSQKDIQSI